MKRSCEIFGLKVRRSINGQVIYGTAAIETALNGDARVIRIRFRENQIFYEQTCLSQSDLDNYARISCYLYRLDKSTTEPGLEALFHDHHDR